MFHFPRLDHTLSALTMHVLSHITDRRSRLRNDLSCVGWGVKLYSLITTAVNYQTNTRTRSVFSKTNDYDKVGLD